MSEMERVCHQALKYFGEKNQIKKCKEELFELILALPSQPPKGYKNKRHLAQEIADVKIMLTQLTEMLGKGLVAEALEFKLKRLEERMQKNKLEKIRNYFV